MAISTGHQIRWQWSLGHGKNFLVYHLQSSKVVFIPGFLVHKSGKIPWPGCFEASPYASPRSHISKSMVKMPKKTSKNLSASEPPNMAMYEARSLSRWDGGLWKRLDPTVTGGRSWALWRKWMQHTRFHGSSESAHWNGKRMQPKSSGRRNGVHIACL